MVDNKLASKIIGIQFSILSPEEIRNGSVAEIKSKDTYINNKPVIGGLFDPRMGVSEPGLLCPTDGLDYMKTPGYFGHMELARPIFYIQYLNIVIKILRCVCIKCSKLLISKERYKQLNDMTPEKRWQLVFNLSKKPANFVSLLSKIICRPVLEEPSLIFAKETAFELRNVLIQP
jgi:DNA-directed RNA polymerase II subunit RPB1